MTDRQTDGQTNSLELEYNRCKCIDTANKRQMLVFVNLYECVTMCESAVIMWHQEEEEEAAALAWSKPAVGELRRTTTVFTNKNINKTFNNNKCLQTPWRRERERE